MRLAQIAHNAFQLTQWGCINCFLLRDIDGFTLIDTAMGQAKPILTLAQSLGAPVRRIVLTHSHRDHAGSLEALHRLLPEARVFLSARETRIFRGDKALDADEPRRPLPGTYVHSRTIPCSEVHEGDRIGSLHVIATPGHTPGHVAFLDESEGTLFAGDAWCITGGLAVAGTLRPWFPLHALGTWDQQLSLHSAHRMCQLKPSRLAVGHGETLQNPLEAMEREVGRMAQRLQVQFA